MDQHTQFDSNPDTKTSESLPYRGKAPTIEVASAAAANNHQPVSLYTKIEKIFNIPHKWAVLPERLTKLLVLLQAADHETAEEHYGRIDVVFADAQKFMSDLQNAEKHRAKKDKQQRKNEHRKRSLAVLKYNKMGIGMNAATNKKRKLGMGRQSSLSMELGQPPAKKILAADKVANTN